MKLEKVIGDKSYYVVEAVPETKAKTLYVVTAFVGKSTKKEASQLIDANAPMQTSENGSVVTSKNSIPQTESSVKSEEEKNSEDNAETSEKSKEEQEAEEREAVEKYSSLASIQDRARRVVENYDLRSARVRYAIEQMYRSADEVGADASAADAAAHLLAVFGGDVEIRFSDQINKNGLIDTVVDADGKRHRVILVSTKTDAEGGATATLLHEVTHYLEGREGYDKLSKLALEQFSKEKAEEIRKRYRDYAKKTGKKYTDEYIEQEVVAEAVGELLAKGKYIARMRNRSAIVNAASWMAQKVKALFGKNREAHRAALKLQVAFTRCLARTKAEAAEVIRRYIGSNNEIGQKNNTDGGARNSVRNNVVDINGRKYERVVELDYQTFNKVKRKGSLYIDFIRRHLINQKIEIFNNDGSKEIVEFARENERVTKDGSASSRRIIGELTQARNELKKLVILNAAETAGISTFNSETDHVNENSHQWLDMNGWDYRTSYVKTNDGMIYPVTLYIAKARDGRNILYDVNVKIKEGVATEKIATSLNSKENTEQAPRFTTSSDTSISQPFDSVKRETKKFSLPKNSTAVWVDARQVEPVNEITDERKYAYLVEEFEQNGYNGRPIVVLGHEGEAGGQALTGSHRIFAAREADIDIPAVYIDYDFGNPLIRELQDAWSDEERVRIAGELLEEGTITQEAYDLIAREDQLNYENEDRPYAEQVRYSLPKSETAEERAERERVAEERRERARADRMAASSRRVSAFFMGFSFGIIYIHYKSISRIC